MQRCKITAVIAVTVLVTTSRALANGDGLLGFYRSDSGKVGFATVASASAGTGTLALTQLSPSATIRAAFFYYNTIQAAVPSVVTFNGTTVAIEQIGTVAGSTPQTRHRSFRADVTSLVPGNGTYSYSVTASGLNRGGALLVVYDDPSLIANYAIEIHDGDHGGVRANQAESSWPDPTVFAGFTVDPTAPREVEIAYLVNDGVAGSTERYLFNGAVLAGDDPATQGFEWDRFDVSAAFLGGETTANASCSELTDTILWQAAVLRVRVTPPQFDRTPPTLTIAAPADPTFVASSPVQVSVRVRDESGTTITSVPPLDWSIASFPAPTAGETNALLPLVEGENTLVVTATDEFGFATSATVTIVLDSTTPFVTIDQPIDGSIVATTTVELQVTVSDANPTAVVSSPAAIDAALPAGGGSVAGTVTLTEGANAIAVSAADVVGNVGGTSITVTRDTTSPTITVISPAPDTVLTSSPATITVAVVDATATHVAIGLAAFDLPAGGGLITAHVDVGAGTNVIAIDVVDAAGNAAYAETGVVLDLDAPLVTIVAPAADSLRGAGEEVVAFVVSIDDVTATQVTSTPAGVAADVPAAGGLVTGSIVLIEGVNSITVSARDAAGRVGSATTTVTLDTTAPIVAVESPAANAAVRGVIDFHATAVDVAPGTLLPRIDLFVDGALLAAFSSSPVEETFDTRLLADGDHTFAITASDAAGNEASAVSLVLVDNTMPFIAINAPRDGDVVARTVTVDVDANDATSGLAALRTLAGGVALTEDASITYAPPVAADHRFGREDTTRRPDGALTFAATATDAAGNEAADSVSVVVDNTAPTKPWLAPADGRKVHGVITISAKSKTRDVTSLEILADGTSLAVTADTQLEVCFDTRTRLDGELVLAAVARDAAGNASTRTSTVTVNNIALMVTPEMLNLRSRAKSQVVTVFLQGPNLPLLLPTEQHAIRLEVPGGNPVPALEGIPDDDQPHDRNGDGIPDLVVKFDRQVVIASIQAGIAAGLIEPCSRVSVSLTVDGFKIGTDRIRIVGR